MTMKSSFALLAFFLAPMIAAMGDWSTPVVIDSNGYPIPKIEARNDSIYVTFDTVFVRSLNGGLIWQDRRQFPSLIPSYGGFVLEGDTVSALVNSGVPDDSLMWLYFSSDFGFGWVGPRVIPRIGPNSDFFRRSDTFFQCDISRNQDNQGVVSFSKSDDFGATWSIPRAVHVYEGGGGSTIYSFFDRVYILSHIYLPGNQYSNVRLLYSSDEGDSWTALDSLAPSNIQAMYPRLGASDNGKMAFVYYDGWSQNPENAHVFACTSTDSGSTWSPPGDISYDGLNNTSPRLEISGDTIVAYWNTNFEYVIRRSYDFGQTWQDIEVMLGIMGDIALDHGVIHEVFLSNDEFLILYYRRWEPGTEAIDDATTPRALSLAPAYPNPFNAATTIAYSLPARCEAKVEVFDILGRRVAILQDGVMGAGQHRAVWGAGDHPSGVYFARLQSGGEVRTRRMVLVR